MEHYLATLIPLFGAPAREREENLENGKSCENLGACGVWSFQEKHIQSDSVVTDDIKIRHFVGRAQSGHAFSSVSVFILAHSQTQGEDVTMTS